MLHIVRAPKENIAENILNFTSFTATSHYAPTSLVLQLLAKSASAPSALEHFPNLLPRWYYCCGKSSSATAPQALLIRYARAPLHAQELLNLQIHSSPFTNLLLLLHMDPNLDSFA